MDTKLVFVLIWPSANAATLSAVFTWQSVLPQLQRLEELHLVRTWNFCGYKPRGKTSMCHWYFNIVKLHTEGNKLFKFYFLLQRKRIVQITNAVYRNSHLTLGESSHTTILCTQYRITNTKTDGIKISVPTSFSQTHYPQKQINTRYQISNSSL